MRNVMTNEQMRDLVKECGLDWHRGFMPLFEGDETNRYAVLIAEAMRIESEACLHIAETTAAGRDAEAIADAIRARNSKGAE